MQTRRSNTENSILLARGKPQKRHGFSDSVKRGRVLRVVLSELVLARLVGVVKVLRRIQVKRALQVNILWMGSRVQQRSNSSEKRGWGVCELLTLHKVTQTKLHLGRAQLVEDVVIALASALLDDTRLLEQVLLDHGALGNFRCETETLQIERTA